MVVADNLHVLLIYHLHQFTLHIHVNLTIAGKGTAFILVVQEYREKSEDLESIFFQLLVVEGVNEIFTKRGCMREYISLILRLNNDETLFMYRFTFSLW